MSDSPADSLDEEPVILCVTSSRTKRAQVARLMSGRGTVLMFPDLKSVRRVLFSETEPNTPAVPVTRVVALGALVVDPDRQVVSWAGKALPLTRTEREVLTALASPRLRVWSYKELYERVWGAEYLDDASAIRSTVKRLRVKLREADATVVLESMRGVGFFLVETDSNGKALSVAGDRAGGGVPHVVDDPLWSEFIMKGEEQPSMSILRVPEGCRWGAPACLDVPDRHGLGAEVLTRPKGP